MQPKLLTDVFQPRVSGDDDVSTRTWSPTKPSVPTTPTPAPIPPRAVSVINTPKGN
jgi:hypothetical protein